MPTLSLINFNIVCATLGGFISVFGLVSYLFKERFYLSEACSFPSRITLAVRSPSRRPLANATQ
jgi:hypothetical protein